MMKKNFNNNQYNSRALTDAEKTIFDELDERALSIVENILGNIHNISKVINSKYNNKNMVNNVNAQKWLDEKYPKNSICKRGNDLKNKNKRREDITTLEISKGKVGNNFFSDSKTLVSSLIIRRLH